MRQLIRTVFVDSSAFFALFNEWDDHYPEASAIQRHLSRWSIPLVTSNFVIAEAHVLFLSRVGRNAALEFIDSITGSGIVVIRASEADEARTVEVLRQYADKEFSYVDALSFAIMERLDIQDAFSFDRHFAQYGLKVLSPETFAT